VVGGTRLFSRRVIFEAKGSVQTVGPNKKTLAYANPTQTNDTGNFQSCYDAQSGKFTTPVGGLKNVGISAGTYSADGRTTDTATMNILVNGKPIAVSDSVGRSARISFVVASLSAGDVITIEQRIYPEVRTLSGDDFNYLQIMASR